MTKRQAYDKVKQGLEADIYRAIRLVKKCEDGKKEILFSFNKNIDSKDAAKKFEYIKFQLDNNLPVGVYEIQCKNAHTVGALVDCFPVEVKEKKQLQIEHKSQLPEKDSTIETEPEVMESIDFEDYVKLIKENAELRAQIKVIEMDRDFYKKLFEAKPATLADGSPIPVEKTAAERGFEALENLAPPLMNLGEKLLNMYERRMNLQEQQLNDTTKNTKRLNGKKPMNDNHFEVQLIRMETLYNANPDKFEEEMDRIEDEEPELYEYLCTEMGIEEEPIDGEPDENN